MHFTIFFSPDLLPNKLHLLQKGKQMGKTRISSSLNRIFLIATIALAFLEITFIEDPLWSNGQDARLTNGRSVVRIRCSANAFELNDLDIRNPLLPAKAEDPQPAVSRSIIAIH